LRSSGTFRLKARRLRAFLDFLGARYCGSAEGMRAEDADELRRALLAVSGVGPETADSIALYAAGKPLFVVGAYTRRVFTRLGLLPGRPPRRRLGHREPGSSTRRQLGDDHWRPSSYDRVQRYLMDRLPRDAALYGDYHAQLVRLGKDHCRPRPRCEGCPLDDLCPKRGVPSSRRARVCSSS
jgi:endonuclease III related protein